MESLISVTVFAIGLALLTMFPAGAMLSGAVIGTILLALTLTMVSGAVLGLVRLPADHD